MTMCVLEESEAYTQVKKEILVKAQKNIELFFAEEKDAQEKQQTR